MYWIWSIVKEYRRIFFIILLKQIACSIKCGLLCVCLGFCAACFQIRFLWAYRWALLNRSHLSKLLSDIILLRNWFTHVTLHNQFHNITIYRMRTMQIAHKRISNTNNTQPTTAITHQNNIEFDKAKSCSLLGILKIQISCQFLFCTLQHEHEDEFQFVVYLKHC